MAAGVFETFAYLFTATDLATPVAMRLQRTVSAVDVKLRGSFGAVAQGVEMMTGAVAKALPAVVKQLNPLTAAYHVFGDAITSSMLGIRKVFTTIDRVAGGVQKAVNTSMANVADRIRYTVQTSVHSVTRGIKSVYKVATQKQFTFAGMFNTIITQTPKAMRVFTSGFVGAFHKISGAFGSFKRLLGSVGGAAGGGLMTLILGPIGPLMKLLEPLLNLISDALAPAFETLGEYIKNAFAPLDYVGELMAQNIGASVQRYIKPLVTYITAIGSAVGVIVQDLLRGRGPIGALGASASHLGKSLLALVPAVVKIATTLAKHVFAPMLTWIANKVAVALEFWSPWIDKLADQVADFFDNFGDYMSTFYDEYLEPVVSFFTDDIPSALTAAYKAVTGFFGDVYDTVSTTMGEVLGFLGLDKLPGVVSGIFDTMMQAILHPIDTLKTFINDDVIGPINKVLTWLGFDPINSFSTGAAPAATVAPPKMAEGGMVMRPTRALVGEAGPEAILPLRPQVLESMMEPVLAKMTPPSTDGIVRLLGRAVELLDDIAQQGRAAKAKRADNDADLDAALGTSALGV